MYALGSFTQRVLIVSSSQLKRSLTGAAQCLREGKTSAAERFIAPLIDNHADHADVQQLAGLLRKQQGRLGEAAEWLAKSLAQAPSAAAHANLANVLLLLGQGLQAGHQYEAALTLDDAFRPARLGLARLALQAHQYDSALRWLQPLIRPPGADPEVDVVYARAISGCGGNKEALDRLSVTLAKRPDYLAAAAARADILLASGEFAAAEQAYRSSPVASATEVSAAGIARAMLAAGQSDDAAVHLKQALAQNPHSTDLHMLHAKLHYMRGDPDYADKLSQALSEQPTHMGLILTMVRVLRGAERFAEAEDALEQALTAIPESHHAPLLLERASVKLEQAAYPEALAYARQAQQRVPDNEAYRAELTQTLLSAGEAREALVHSEWLLNVRPDNQQYLAYFADACRALDDPRAQDLLDCSRRVRRFELPVPPGWPTLESFLAELSEALVERHQFDKAPLDQSLRGGTQTQASLLNDNAKSVQGLLQSFDTCIQHYRDELGNTASDPVARRNRGAHRLSGCWSVRLSDGGFHVDHLHPEGWISSAFYVSVPASVRADDPERRGWLRFGVPRFDQPGADALHYERPEPGVLVLFPSYLWHGTVPFVSDEYRLSVAFDVVPVSTGD